MSCPFCDLAAGRASGLNRCEDIVHRDELTTAFVSPRWWEAAPGHVIVVPNEHVKDIEAISPELLGAVYATARRIAIAMRKVYACQGTSTRQHDGAGAGQEIPHLHVHVFPRSAGDGLYERNGEWRWTSPEEREPLAEGLRAAL